MGTRLQPVACIMLLLGAILLPAGCSRARLAGTYYGSRGVLGQQVLRVERDGTLVDEYGIPDQGTWHAVGDSTIAARLHLLGGGVVRRYYRLDRVNRTFDWAADLDTLQRRCGSD